MMTSISISLFCLFTHWWTLHIIWAATSFAAMPLPPCDQIASNTMACRFSRFKNHCPKECGGGGASASGGSSTNSSKPAGGAFSSAFGAAGAGDGNDEENKDVLSRKTTTTTTTSSAKNQEVQEDKGPTTNDNQPGMISNGNNTAKTTTTEELPVDAATNSEQQGKPTTSKTNKPSSTTTTTTQSSAQSADDSAPVAPVAAAGSAGDKANSKCNKVDPCVDAETANKGFLERCKSAGIASTCWEKCRYDVTFDELKKAIIGKQCPIDGMRDYLKCGANGHDSRDCCQKTGVLDGKRAFCYPFCNPYGTEWPAAKEALKYLPCSSQMNAIMKCHWAGLTP